MRKPKTLKEAIIILDEVLNKTDKIERDYINSLASVDDMICYHNNVGRDMRNQWGLWRSEKSLELKTELKNFGCGEHPDDMSMFILNLFYHHIKSPESSIETVINEQCIKKLLE
jgi:hypothetical protein